MDRENMTPNSTTIADKKMPYGPDTGVVKRENGNNGNADEDYPEWKEGYLAEIYLAENRKDSF